MYILPVETLNNLLLNILGGSSQVNRWWNTPNESFDMKKPRDVYIDDPEKITLFVLDISNR